MGVDPPIGGLPIALSPATFDRHDAAVRYVEGMIQTRIPRDGSGRSPWLAPGAWGLLAASATISGVSGTTLGTGTVTLCDRSGSALKSPPETVSVANSGAAITAGGSGKLVRLAWVLGEWVVSCGG
jgi:hypothetical protein